MSYDEEQQRKSRVVVETPTARREVYQTQTTRYPDRSGYSTGTVAAVALTAIALTAIVFLFLMTRGDDTTEVNVNAQAPYPQASVVAAQPTPFVVPTPLPMTTPIEPLVITPPAGTTTTTTTVPGAVVVPPAPAPTPNVPDDTALQNTVSKRIQDDPDLSTTDIIATVSDGKATLTGTVNAPDLKRRAERIALSVRGVRRVENQIAVTPGPETEPTTP